MKIWIVITLLTIACIPSEAQHFGFSSGLYRIPYANNVEGFVVSDVYTHDPLGKYDIVTDATAPVIVAASDGWVRWIEEDFDTSCHQVISGTVHCCWQQNNYVVIEHPNGEWSQYTHMNTGSVSAAGITLNQWVTAGTPIGTEGTIGCSTGPHLHFEVSQPLAGAVPFDTIGGFLNTNGAEMLIPVIGGTGLSQSWMADSDDIIGGPSDDNCPTSTEVTGDLAGGAQFVARTDDFIITDNAATMTYSPGSSSIYRAGEYIRLRPGFHVQGGAKFKVIVKGCNEYN